MTRYLNSNGDPCYFNFKEVTPIAINPGRAEGKPPYVVLVFAYTDEKTAYLDIQGTVDEVAALLGVAEPEN